ncbi:hypothetical protein LCGC14_1471750 [marine sediment metagenome]|uniref:Uncharacterized protein n=1 Tax=marine sediment metagenome TaxID=412755 RepID=A0A0F9JC49_9ZZZZ
MSNEDGEFPEDQDGHRDCRQENESLHKQLQESQADRERMRRAIRYAWREAESMTPVWLADIFWCNSNGVEATKEAKEKICERIECTRYGTQCNKCGECIDEHCRCGIKR